MMTPQLASSFAASWYAAWNAHDLDAIMGHYAAGIEHSSPFIARYHTDPKARTLVGIAVVREYFRKALERNPNLKFLPRDITVGLESVILVYNRMTGDLAAEVFLFDGAGKVVRSISHYGA